MTVPIINRPFSLRPPHQPFDNAAAPVPVVIFLHPGYADNDNFLLKLPAFDSGGIHHDTARIACAILAACRWDGFLSSTRNGTPLPAGPDDVLPPGRYYFCIEGEDQYPVVPNFDHFICPDILPPPYTYAPILSSTGDDAVRRDRTCRITASSLPNETAHIIPSAQSDWWQRNRMPILYTGNAERGLDRSAENTILLRRDLHKMWDDNKFAIVPKAGKWAVHVLWHSPIVEIQERYHNLELQPLADVSRHFFLCRFAMAVFSKSVFLIQKVPRKLVVVGDNGSNHVKVQNMAVDEYQQFCMTSTRASSRSQSPKKRQRSAAGDLVDDGYTTEESEETGDDDSEEERGRPRKRKWSPSPWRSSALSEYPDDETDALILDTRKSSSPDRKRLRSSAGLDRLRTPPRSTSPI